MKPLDSQLLKKFVKLLGDIEGEWVIIGGTLLPLLGVDYRSTVDIDVVSINPSGNQESLALMELAEKLHLPVESINQAGALFLHRLPDFRDNLVLVHKGRKSKIFRPNLGLYLQLKSERLNETDLEDCLQFIKWCRKHAIKEIESSFLRMRRKVKTKTKEQASRLERLLSELKKLSG